MRRWVLGGIALILSGWGWAETTAITPVSPLKKEGVSWTKETASKEDETALEQAASQWHLSMAQYEKYLQLMKETPAKHWYATLDPPEVLGNMANSQQELNEYARIEARVMHERVRHEIAFNNAYHQAFLSQYPEHPVEIPGTEKVSARSLTVGDRLVLFTAVKTSMNQALIERLMQRIKINPVKLDIYILGSVTDMQISAWAKTMKIDPLLLSSSDVTLNHDQGLFKRVVPQREAVLPSLVLEHAGTSTLVSLNTV